MLPYSNNTVFIGHNATADTSECIAIGYTATSNGSGAVAIGASATANAIEFLPVGTSVRFHYRGRRTGEIAAIQDGLYHNRPDEPFDGYDHDNLLTRAPYLVEAIDPLQRFTEAVHG
jgi:hypothetical protein